MRVDRAKRLTAQLRRSIFAISALSVVTLPTALAAEGRQPNLVLIMADDLGYETIGANGGTSYKTPNLDQLAASGVRFAHCYVQPLCTPTRIQLMTGLSNVRNYTAFGQMDRGAVTFANRLKAAGYATCIAGKWQLGQSRELPRKFGFDEACLWQHFRRPPRYANPGLEINGDAKDYRDGEYGPDVVNAFALDFITRHKDGPFLLYYPMMLTHSPYQPTPDSPDWDREAQGEKTHTAPRHFGEMVTYMDKLVGRLVDRLDELGIRDETLVIFLGDNGTGRGTRSMMGDQEVFGGKGTTTAAGMHVPLIVSWPGQAARGKVCADLVDSTDFFPTLLDAAGVNRADERLDGRSFLPQIRGELGQPREWIYSWYSPRQGENRTVREFTFNREFKLYRSGELYDLRADRAEKSPLAAESLSKDAKGARQTLQAALDQFAHARPPELDQSGSPPARPKKKLQRKK